MLLISKYSIYHDSVHVQCIMVRTMPHVGSFDRGLETQHTGVGQECQHASAYRGLDTARRCWSRRG
jgi:hypothetical protein